MAANYGQDYYLEKARAGQHTFGPRQGPVRGAVSQQRRLRGVATGCDS